MKKNGHSAMTSNQFYRQIIRKNDIDIVNDIILLINIFTNLLFYLRTILRQIVLLDTTMKLITKTSIAIIRHLENKL